MENKRQKFVRFILEGIDIVIKMYLGMVIYATIFGGLGILGAFVWSALSGKNIDWAFLFLLLGIYVLSIVLAAGLGKISEKLNKIGYDGGDI